MAPYKNETKIQWKGFTLWLSLVIGIMMFVKGADSFTPTERNQINEGLQAGQAITTFLSSQKFSGAMTKIATSASVYIGALGPFIGAVLAFIPAQSAELAYMKEMMERIDNRFDQMDVRLNNVERLLIWNAVKVNFGHIEQKIRAMAEEYELLYEAPKPAVENRKTIFLSNYESDYENSGTKLYQAMLSNGPRVFQEKLGNAVMEYTEYNRTHTQYILLGIMQLLFHAVKIELAYYQVQGFSANAMFMKNKWASRMQEVRREFTKVDEIVRDKYHEQSGIDLLSFARRKTYLSNGDFASELYDKLAGKYYWRDWVIIIYDDISGWDKHTVGVCDGHIKFRQNGRNIVVGSVDENSSVMDLDRAGREMRDVDVTWNDRHWYLGDRYKTRRAVGVYDSLDKRDACVVAVIRCYQGLNFSYVRRRLKYVSRCPHFNLIMFG